MNGVRYVDNVFSLSRPGIGLLLIYMSVEGLFFFLLTLVIEVYILSQYASYECLCEEKDLEHPIILTTEQFVTV